MAMNCVALAARRAVGLQGYPVRLPALFLGAVACLLTPEAHAQSVTIGGLGANSAVCTDAGGQIVSQNGGVSGNECSGAATPADGNITATGTITGGTLIATTGLSVFDGGITVFNDDINMNGGNINNVATLNSTTIVNSGNTKTDSLTVDNNATVGGTLSVGGDVSIGGNLDMTGGDINNVATLNASTVNATTGNITTLNSTTIVNSGNTKTGSLTVDNDATIGANLTVTGTSNLDGGANIANHLTVAPGTAVSMGNNRVQDVATPIAANDAANKAYVDSGLASAFKEIDRNTQGIAIAMAMGGLALPDSKNFALSANLGFFDSKQAIAVQGAMRLSPFVTLNGGVGLGADDASTVGGRVGVQVAW